MLYPAARRTRFGNQSLPQNLRPPLEICCMLIKICAVGPDRVHESSPLECEGFVALRTMKICRMGAKKASECHETRNLWLCFGQAPTFVHERSIPTPSPINLGTPAQTHETGHWQELQTSMHCGVARRMWQAAFVSDSCKAPPRTGGMSRGGAPAAHSSKCPRVSRPCGCLGAAPQASGDMGWRYAYCCSLLSLLSRPRNARTHFVYDWMV